MGNQRMKKISLENYIENVHPSEKHYLLKLFKQ